ncbi:MAG: hypothetical protein GY798_21620 [Hyphomicrobiales bacterium]|nr:hypothetical protein [Hyphomicrobiales bacterium]
MNGCAAETSIDESLWTRLVEGETARFIYFQTQEKGSASPISLAGLRSGFDALP